MADGTPVKVTVVYSPGPRVVDERAVTLAAGASLKDALLASGMLVDHPGLAQAQPVLGVWGRKAALSQAVEEGDRVEIYRPLTVDPKVARRERFRSQGARGAGLFAKRRPGAKPGY